MTNGQNTIIAPLIDMYRVKFGTKNFRLRVLRDTGWFAEYVKVGKITEELSLISILDVIKEEV